MEGAQPDDIIKQVTEMGFSENAAKRAFKNAELKNLEGLVIWISDHEKDPDLNDPLPEPAPGDQSSGQPGDAPKGKSISGIVNQKYATLLQSKGYSKNASEKALLMSGNKSVEDAMEWIYENQNQPDFEEEMLIVDDPNVDPTKPKEPPKILTEAEKIEAAKELQRQVRERRVAREKEEAEQREKDRVRATKEMAAAKRQLDEAEIRRAAELKAKERDDDDKARQKILDQIQKDREERFGKAAPPASKSIPPLDQIKETIRKIKTVYPTHSYKKELRDLMTTVKAYTENILKNPTEEKFQKINQNNKVFQERVGAVIGGTKILAEAGFEDKDGFLVLKKPLDTKLLDDIVKLMDYELYYLT